jgi:hypothetical protein
MDADRGIGILVTGLKAAHEQIFKGLNTTKAEHPHDLTLLYSWSETALFELFDAIKAKQPDKIRENAGSVIVLMSEIAEQAEIAGHRAQFGDEDV